MAVINKAISNIVFSNYPQLTLLAKDLAEEMITLTVDDDFSNRLRGATSSVISPNPYAVSTVSARVLTTSPQCNALIAQCEASNTLDGNVVFTDPTKKKFLLTNLELMYKEVQGDGQQAFIEFTIRGDYQINKELVI